MEQTIKLVTMLVDIGRLVSNSDEKNAENGTTDMCDQ